MRALLQIPVAFLVIISFASKEVFGSQFGNLRQGYYVSSRAHRLMGFLYHPGNIIRRLTPMI